MGLAYSPVRGENDRRGGEGSGGGGVRKQECKKEGKLEVENERVREKESRR
jgi:hypothetical protein